MRAIVLAAVLLAATPAAASNPLRYKVMADEAGEIHRTVEIRLENRLSEEGLEAIAAAVQQRAPRVFRRTLVNFYLPGMKAGQGAWATATHAGKSISVRVAGLKLDEEEAFVVEARVDGRSMIGTWLTSTPAAPGRLTIFRERGKLYAEWRLRNGVKTVDEVAERRDGAGRRFDIVPATADHYVLLGSGALELRQADRVVAVAERIDLSAPAKAAVAQARPQPQTAEPVNRISAALAAPGNADRRRALVVLPVDPDEPQKLVPRAGIGAAMEAQARIEPRLEPLQKPAEPVAEAVQEPTRSEQADAPPRKAAAPSKPRPRTRSASSGAVPGQGTAQDRLIKQLFRNPY